LLGVAVIGADCGRKHVERKAVAAAVDVTDGVRRILIVAANPVVALEAALVTIAARTTRSTILAVSLILAIVTFGVLGVAGLDQLLVAFVLVHLLVAVAARILILEPGAILAQDAEIMIRELEIIFGLDAVARELRVARHALVFLEQLRGIAALTVVLAVPGLSTQALAPLSPAAAPAAALTIVDQMPTPFAVVASPLGPQSGRAARCGS